MKGDHIVILLLISLCSFSVFLQKSFKALHQDSENIVVAKGDIPTPRRIYSQYLTIRQKAVDQVTFVETALKISLLTVKNQLTDAQLAYQQAHYHYEVIRPIIALFGATERLLNNRADFNFLERKTPSPF